jgi:hypothetical protein
LLLARFYGVDVERAIEDKWLSWHPLRSRSEDAAR